MKKLLGFTLAEVLITIGVIGAVSVMVIPNIRLAYSKKLTLTQLEKTYSTLANTIRMSEYHNGKVKRWKFECNNAGSKKFFDTYFKGYMKYALEMPSSELTIGTYQSDANHRKYLSGQALGGDGSGNGFANLIYKKEGRAYHVVMMDGSMISFYTRLKASSIPKDVDSVLVAIDTNGESSPNTLGKDTFLFTITHEAGLLPLGDGKGPASNRATATNIHDSRAMYLGRNSDPKPASCNKDKRGEWCAALIMLDGWHISKDYPWDKH